MSRRRRTKVIMVGGLSLVVVIAAVIGWSAVRGGGGGHGRSAEPLSLRTDGLVIDLSTPLSQLRPLSTGGERELVPSMTIPLRYHGRDGIMHIELDSAQREIESVTVNISGGAGLFDVLNAELEAEYGGGFVRMERVRDGARVNAWERGGVGLYLYDRVPAETKPGQVAVTLIRYERGLFGEALAPVD